MAAASGQPRRHSLTWLQGLACGAVVALLPGVALLLGVLLLPGMLALLYDRQPGRPVARTVLLCASAATIRPVFALWDAGVSIEASLGLVTDLRVIGTAWSAAAVGWILAELSPVVALVILEAMTQAQAARLRAERDKLAAEWGFDEDGARQ